MNRLIISYFLAGTLAVLSPTTFAANASAGNEAAAPVAESPEVRLALRDLWVEHVFWIRSYFIAVHAGDSPQQEVAAGEVVANARAIAAAIVPFYGQAASEALLGLLAGHWGAVRDYGLATFDTNAEAQAAAIDMITANAHEIAKFLSTANPYLPEDAVFGLLSAHGGHHVQQVNEIADGDWAGEASVWVSMRAHMIVIADALADALARQFPNAKSGVY